MEAVLLELFTMNFLLDSNKASLIRINSGTNGFRGVRVLYITRIGEHPLEKRFYYWQRRGISMRAKSMTNSNGLADSLSRFSDQKLADLCPHWQIPFFHLNRPLFHLSSTAGPAMVQRLLWFDPASDTHDHFRVGVDLARFGKWASIGPRCCPQF